MIDCRALIAGGQRPPECARIRQFLPGAVSPRLLRSERRASSKRLQVEVRAARDAVEIGNAQRAEEYCPHRPAHHADQRATASGKHNVRAENPQGCRQRLR